MRRATLGNSELFFHKWEERELFWIGLSTLADKLRIILEKNRSKDKFCRVNFCDIYPFTAFQLFCSNFLYSSNVYFSFTWLLTLTIFSDKIKGQILSGQFLSDLPVSAFQLFHLFLLLQCVLQRFRVVENVTGTPTERSGHFWNKIVFFERKLRGVPSYGCVTGSHKNRGQFVPTTIHHASVKMVVLGKILSAVRWFGDLFA